MKAQNGQIIYVGDPMCSWCYGISSEVQQLKATYSKTYDFAMVMGGLRPYNDQSMTELKSFLMEHWKEVGHASGQKFTYDILDRSDLKYDTEPPSRACIVVRKLDRSKEFDFFKEIQKLFYLKNHDLSDVNNYRPIIEDLGLDFQVFKVNFESDKFKELIREDFMLASELGVSSFPTLLFSYNGQVVPIAKGYAACEDMIDRIDQVVNKN